MAVIRSVSGLNLQHRVPQEPDAIRKCRVLPAKPLCQERPLVPYSKRI